MAKDRATAGVDPNVRDVTPGNPLIINETQPTFEDVVIQGGEIIAQVQTTTTFRKLTKES